MAAYETVNQIVLLFFLAQIRLVLRHSENAQTFNSGMIYGIKSEMDL